MAAGTRSKSDYERAFDRLTRLLTLRDHSLLELTTKLSRDFTPTLISEVLDEARDRGLLKSDQAVADHLRLGYDRRLKSARYITERLRQKGLPLPDPAQAAESDVAKAHELIERKFGDPLGLSPIERQRALQYLNYRGFDDRAIRRVLANEEY